MTLFFLLPSGFALFSCNVSEEAINAVKQVLESICPKLNLHSQSSVISLKTANQIKQHLERHSLQFCVLVVEGETIIKDAYENLPARKVEYEDLFKTSVQRVGKIRAHFVIKKINVSTLFFSHPIYLINFYMAFVCMCTQFLHGLHVVRLVASVFLSSIVEVGRKERRKEGRSR